MKFSYGKNISRAKAAEMWTLTVCTVHMKTGCKTKQINKKNVAMKIKLST